jgi:formylglycine-generating enzyme required for sulfatase activity/tRNA A-37 threonylcarbamoyl transferase component Bud32
MGEIGVAWDGVLRRRVAVKRAHAGLGTKIRLLDEAQIMAQLEHPGIVPVHDMGLDERDEPYFTMTYVRKGRTLAETLKRRQEAGTPGQDESDDAPEGAWTQTRVLNVLLRVCEAVAFAHSKGVLHRDLKPDNIMVGRFGEVLVLDWGIAKVEGTREIAPDVALDPTNLSGSISLATDRSIQDDTELRTRVAGTPSYMPPEQAWPSLGKIGPHSDVYSMGAMLYELLAEDAPYGRRTPAVEVIQQLRKGAPSPLSVKAHDQPSELVAICEKAMARSPEERYTDMIAMAEDLRAFVEHRVVKAYQEEWWWPRLRKWGERNRGWAATIGGLIVALSAGLGFSLHFGVEANSERTSVLRLSALQDLEDLRDKADSLWPPHPENIGPYLDWMEHADALVAELPRHRRKHNELCALALPPNGLEQRAERERHPEFGRVAALTNEIEAKHRALLQRRDGVAAGLPTMDWSEQPESAKALYDSAWKLVRPGRISFGREPEGLVLAVRALQMAEGTNDELTAFVNHTLSLALFALGQDKEALQASRAGLSVAPESQREKFEGYLADLEDWIEHAASEEGIGQAEKEIAQLELELSEVEGQVGDRRDWRFPDTKKGRNARWWETNLSKLIGELEALTDEKTGLLAPTALSSEHGWSVPKRLSFAQDLARGYSPGGEYTALWERDLPAIATAYPGLNIGPQMGLVPIGSDPSSGLWEFAHLMSGVPAVRGDDGNLVLAEGTGIVLVLMRGGSFHRGAQNSDRGGRSYDPQAESVEQPVREITLSPFFVAKYEMTQGQWFRVMGSNPSYYGVGVPNYNPQWNRDRRPASLLHPVEHIDRFDCQVALERLGLGLPSEAQWEYSARSGSSLPWWSGARPEELVAVANLADAWARSHGGPPIWTYEEWEDGQTVHAAVGSFAGNHYGLFDVHGNVAEWCHDGYRADYYATSPSVEPSCDPSSVRLGVVRGGTFATTSFFARSSSRSSQSPDIKNFAVGVRPARGISQ